MSRFWTSLPPSSGDKTAAQQSLWQRTLPVLCLLALVSCGPIGNGPAKTPAGSHSPADSVAPPQASVRPPQPGQLGQSYTPDGLPALQPARGLNAENLFSEQIRDPADRVQRVENAVVELRRDFDAVLPAIVRLSAVEADMQALLKQLESLLRNEPLTASHAHYAPETAQPALSTNPAPATQNPVPQTPPAQAAPQPLHNPPAAQAAPPAQAQVQAQATLPPPVAAPVTPPAVAPQTAPAQSAAAQAPAGKLAVSAMRFGEYPDRTRFVMDMTGPARYHHDLDNGENLLMIELPATDWQAAQSQNLPRSTFIQSYNIQPMDNGGTRLILLLKRAAQVSYHAALGPEAPNGHRIVFDLRAP